jgi:hypothetical protein
VALCRLRERLDVVSADFRFLAMSAIVYMDKRENIKLDDKRVLMNKDWKTFPKRVNGR